MKKSLFIILLAIFSAINISAKDEESQWQPTAQWPFVYKEFSKARIITSAGKAVHGDANIHVGMHYLWFINGQKKKLAAVEGSIKQVAFNNGDIYMAVEKKLCKVVLEDTINGQVCRIYCSEEVDKPRFDEMTRNSKMNMTTFDLGASGFDNFANRVAENEGLGDVDQVPLPMSTIYYMLYDGETFQVTESNILKHIEKAKRGEYRAFTRKEEIIYNNESSVLKIWNSYMKK